MDAFDTTLPAVGGVQSAFTADEALSRATMFVAAALLLVFCLPMMLLTGLAVWVSDGGPMLFRHERIGRAGEKFQCGKFRSMMTDPQQVLERHLLADADAAMEWRINHKLRNDPRVTPLGRFLRASSLDELPQLWNVLRGDMSLVGPRPITTAEISKYGESFSDYCAVRPGITGLWQVSGRSEVSYAERVALDVRYARERSLGMDVKILALTLPAVLERRGSY